MRTMRGGSGGGTIGTDYKAQGDKPNRKAVLTARPKYARMQWPNTPTAEQMDEFKVRAKWRNENTNTYRSGKGHSPRDIGMDDYVVCFDRFGAKMLRRKERKPADAAGAIYKKLSTGGAYARIAKPAIPRNYGRKARSVAQIVELSVEMLKEA